MKHVSEIELQKQLNTACCLRGHIIGNKRSMTQSSIAGRSPPGGVVKQEREFLLLKSAEKSEGPNFIAE